MAKRATRITVDLGSEYLYKAVKIEAVQRGMTLRDVVVIALKDWLRQQEEHEDLAAYREAKGDVTRPLSEFLSEIGESGLRAKDNQVG